MEIIRVLESFPKIDSAVLTIGKFDGMHLAHREVLSKTKKISKIENRKFVVISFSNHPYVIIKPDRVPNHLSNEKFKISYLEEIGCDYLILLDFSREIIETSHSEFLNFILEKIKYIHFVLGYDFKFGKDNIGDISYLKNFCEKHYDRAMLTVVNKIEINDNNYKISSSLIKKLLKDGLIKKANYYLGREYYIESEIINGDKIGQKIGFPTINMYIEEMEYPKNGVYFTRIEIENIDSDNKMFSGYGMTYVGRRYVKGLQKDIRLIETNIFNLNEDLYGKNARIYFLERLRDVIEFDSLDSLKKQLIKDKNKCKNIMEEKCH